MMAHGGVSAGASKLFRFTEMNENNLEGKFKDAKKKIETSQSPKFRRNLQQCFKSEQIL